MEAGKLRNRVTIERRTITADEYGQNAAAAWAEVAVVSAAVHPMTAREMVRAGQAGQETMYVVSMRYRCDVRPSDRIRWNGLYLNIVGMVNVDGRNRELELRCAEQQGG